MAQVRVRVAAASCLGSRQLAETHNAAFLARYTDIDGTELKAKVAVKVAVAPGTPTVNGAVVTNSSGARHDEKWVMMDAAGLHVAALMVNVVEEGS